MLKLAGTAKLAVLGAVFFGVVSITQGGHAAADPLSQHNGGMYGIGSQSEQSPPQSFNNSSYRSGGNNSPGYSDPVTTSDSQTVGDTTDPSQQTSGYTENNGSNIPPTGNTTPSWGTGDNQTYPPTESTSGGAQTNDVNQTGPPSSSSQTVGDTTDPSQQTSGYNNPGIATDTTDNGNSSSAPCPTQTDNQSTPPSWGTHKTPCPLPQKPVTPCPSTPPVITPCPKPPVTHPRPPAPCPTHSQPPNTPCPPPPATPPSTPPQGGMGGGPQPTPPMTLTSVSTLTPVVSPTPTVIPASVVTFTPAPAELTNTGVNIQFTSVIAIAFLTAAGFVFSRRTASND